jgi:hypothetical protein
MPDIIELGEVPHHASEYLNPVYWQPHEVGDDDAVLVPHDVPSKSEADEAQRILREYKEGGGKGVALSTYVEFDIADHPPGTMFGFDVEYLHASKDLEIDKESYAGVQPPVRTPNFWPHTDITMIGSTVCSYASFASGTVVVQRGKRLPPRAVGAYLGFSPTIEDAGMIYHPSKFTVGETRHVQYGPGSPLSGQQVFSRINRVDLLLPGKTETARRTVLALGGLLRPRTHGA